jgi:hypothetical protein
MLRNRFYVGEVRYKNEIYPGPQPPIVDRELFEAVQARLTAQWSHRTVTRHRSVSLLAGLLFDDAGHPMVATYATKNGVRYRYYVSEPHLRGLAKLSSSSVARVPAANIEAVVFKALAAHLRDSNTSAMDQSEPDRSIVAAYVARIEVHKNQLAVRLKSPDGATDADQNRERDPLESKDTDNGSFLLIPWRKPPSKKFRELLLPPSVSRRKVRPMKAERRATLLKSIARGRTWLDDIISGAAQGVEDIAARHKCSVRHVNMTISMAFTAPALITAAVEGRLSRGIGVASLRDAPAEWSRQFERLGLTQPT